MITIKEESGGLIKVDIKLCIPKDEVIAFLKNKGYTVNPFTVEVPPNEEFLISEPGFTYSTLAAMKCIQTPTYKDLYLNVYETELNNLLNTETRILF